ncbi:MAG: hypothetical protein JXN61_13375 [Sedimentisphaerales bacterium]|nr:hypothetical protein [Sedimentisphaerales bacterium]
MFRKYSCSCAPALLLLLAATSIQAVEMTPFAFDWRDNSDSLVNLSFLLDAPAGKNGFVRVAGGHLVKPDGERLRIWGVNFTGSACFPSKEDAPVVAEHLARFGINCVRFHFLDSNWSASLFVRGSDNTRELDSGQLDRLDFFVAELKKRGIYANINLNVGRNYRKGDGVEDYEYLGLAKVVNYFDEHIQMLHREYAGQLLTHFNPYTKAKYRREPAVVIVELVNENSIVEAWFSDRLLGKNTQKRPGTWADIPASYEKKLTQRYNSWLKERLSPTELQEMRSVAGVKEGELIPRLTTSQFDKADKERFGLEAEFYMELQDAYFQMMHKYLKETIAVESLIVGTSDHNHWKTGYPLLAATSKLDVVDGHVYWQHPRYLTDPGTKRQTFSIPNTAMVNDPFNSTIVQLSRSAVAGKPYTVSETNHPFPNEYACEGIGILAAYSSFHDWDGIFLYTFEHGDPSDWAKRMPGHFEIRPDPVRMTNLAAGAIMFLRQDIKPALKTIDRSYSAEQVRDGIRAPSSERPYFTPGFDLSIPLRHTTRVVSFDEGPVRYEPISVKNPVVSDTKELVWHYPPEAKGLVTVETDKSQAIIGFVGGDERKLKNLSVRVTNEFCSIILTSLDAKPVSDSAEMLLAVTARSENTGMKWNEKRTSLVDWGTAPMVIEPVAGEVMLLNLKPYRNVEAIPLDGAGKPIGGAVKLKKSSDSIEIAVGEPVTTWYLIRIER